MWDDDEVVRGGVDQAWRTRNQGKTSKLNDGSEISESKGRFSGLVALESLEYDERTERHKPLSNESPSLLALEKSFGLEEKRERERYSAKSLHGAFPRHSSTQSVCLNRDLIVQHSSTDLIGGDTGEAIELDNDLDRLCSFWVCVGLFQPKVISVLE